MTAARLDVANRSRHERTESALWGGNVPAMGGKCTR